jgi:SpoVK/Ycf46/Vps4 family AAA+-type ATPase
VIRRWTRQAPAILIIEDLNWLLEQVNVSTFLNLLDGIDSRAGNGLLIIATTNHPNELDPAINNRPGRRSRRSRLACCT